LLVVSRRFLLSCIFCCQWLWDCTFYFLLFVSLFCLFVAFFCYFDLIRCLLVWFCFVVCLFAFC
jgi:hypothetical protein